MTHVLLCPYDAQSGGVTQWRKVGSGRAELRVTVSLKRTEQQTRASPRRSPHFGARFVALGQRQRASVYCDHTHLIKQRTVTDVLGV